MKIVRGVVAMLGYTNVKRKSVTYSVVEVGQQAILDLTVPKRLIKYLTRALHSPDESVLFILDGQLVGIQSAGSMHYHYANRMAGLIFVVLSVVAIPVFGLGLIMLRYSYKY